MKKTWIISFVVLAACLLVALAPVSGGLSGSAHDFSSTGWSGGKLCGPCHTPHNADPTGVQAPLWSHEVTQATYTVYTSPTMNAEVDQPGGISRLCLSCHDGTVAIDSFGGSNGSTMISGSANLGTDLGNSHPISFTYDTDLATADGGLHNPAVAKTTFGGTIAEDLLFSGRMECASCHDVHNTETTGEALLRITTNGSQLCLTCHDM